MSLGFVSYRQVWSNVSSHLSRLDLYVFKCLSPGNFGQTSRLISSRSRDFNVSCTSLNLTLMNTIVYHDRLVGVHLPTPWIRQCVSAHTLKSLMSRDQPEDALWSHMQLSFLKRTTSLISGFIKCEIVLRCHVTATYLFSAELTLRWTSCFSICFVDLWGNRSRYGNNFNGQQLRKWVWPYLNVELLITAHIGCIY